jgi:phage repressor protein C with HTH and peptisase S24 domain
MITQLGQRLKESRKRVRLTQSAVADAVGISQSTYQELESGKSKKSAHLTQIALVLGVNPNWLANGQDAPSSDTLTPQILENTTIHLLNNPHNNEGRILVDVVNIKFLEDLDGSIAFDFSEVVDKIPFYETFFKKRGVNPDDVRLAYAPNDAQEPYVHAGDLIGIDTSDTDVKDGNYYAIYFEGELMLMQIFKKQGGLLILSNTNPLYKDRDKIVDTSNTKSFKVIGRQFWRAG